MSFDLALAKGSVAIGTDGDLRKIRQGSKLTQDVLKVLHTPVGSDPFFPSKGSPLTEANIGEVVNQQFVESRAQAGILEALRSIQSIQERQSKIQTVTEEETIADIHEVLVRRDEQEPRQYNINVTVLTGAFSTVSIPEFSIRTQIG